MKETILLVYLKSSDFKGALVDILSNFKTEIQIDGDFISVKEKVNSNKLIEKLNEIIDFFKK